MEIIIYLITIIIAYISIRYFVIKQKYGLSDDPQIVSLIVAIFWPVVLIIFCIWSLGDYIDKTIKSKVNE